MSAADAHGEADAAVIERLGRGDLDALSSIYERYGGQAYGLAFRMTNDPSLAEDAVQEAFVGVWRHARSYDPRRGSVRTWLLTVVHHRAIDLIRRRRSHDTLPESDSEVQPPSALVLPDIWGEVSERLDRESIERALGALPAAQREAIELAYFRGFTQVEIARSTDAPLGTVKSRVRLGLLGLRRALEDEDARGASDP